VSISPRLLAKSIRKTALVTDRSPHLCRSSRPLSPATLGLPLLTSVDQWGYTPFPLQRLTPHSLSRRVRDLLAGDLGTHRDLPVDTEDTDTQTPVPVREVRRGVYSARDAERAWMRRRADPRSLDNVEQELTDIDRRVDQLNQRASALLSTDSDHCIY